MQEAFERLLFTSFKIKTNRAFIIENKSWFSFSLNMYCICVCSLPRCSTHWLSAQPPSSSSVTWWKTIAPQIKSLRSHHQTDIRGLKQTNNKTFASLTLGKASWSLASAADGGCCCCCCVCVCVCFSSNTKKQEKLPPTQGPSDNSTPAWRLLRERRGKSELSDLFSSSVSNVNQSIIVRTCIHIWTAVQIWMTHSCWWGIY